MSAIPSNISRVPTLLASQIQLSSINRSGTALVELQGQLASGERIARPSDDVIGTGALSVVEDRLEKRDQNLRNLEHARGTLDTLDSSLAEATSILLETKSIASSQIGVGSDEATRESQAVVIEAMLLEMTNIGNRKYQLLHLFGGEQTDRPPFEELFEGIRYAGTDQELQTDLPVSRAIPLTLPGSEAFGATSARQQGRLDLDPAAELDTRLADLNGALGLGVRLGSINVDIDGVDMVVDLTGAHTVGDVVDTLGEAIQGEDNGASVSLGPSGIVINPSGGRVITITDQAAPSTAADLGLVGAFVGGANTSGGDLDARITDLTRLESLDGLASPRGSLRLENLSRVREIDLDAIETVQELRNEIEGLGIGVRVSISEAGDRLDFVNEVSGGWMSIGEIDGGDAASRLGVRTFDRETRLDEFNDGRGVDILAGASDPISGDPAPDRDIDFAIELKDGTEIEVDLAAAVTVGDVIDRIQAAAVAAGVAVPADFSVGLVGEGNGIQINDATAGGVGTTQVVQRNGSYAAEDLGIAGTTDGASIAGEDRARVAVEGVFSRLISLRDALRTNDERGITFAGEGLEDDINRVTEVRAEVGVRSRRLFSATQREEDLQILDQSLRSEIRDLDFTEAAVRFNLLQQQLQAGLSSASRLVQTSLLDFLR
ncbi:MAG: flagellin [Phycisphaerales bacterium]